MANGSACATLTSCEDCVEIRGCFFCTDDNTCYAYDYGLGVIPKSDKCSLFDMKWSTCWFNLPALLIALGVVVFICLVACIVAYCWCKGKCRKRRRKKLEKEELKRVQQTEERRAISEGRSQERKKKREEIRKKYGLLPGQNPYSKMSD